ncbi:cytochrome P450, partial [Hysterangium stoloniferum]
PKKHNEWVQNLGRTFRFNGFGKFDYRLVTTDLRALSHILNSPVYEKPWQTQKMLGSFLGRGVSVMEGPEHMRLRKIVAPAFSNSNIRHIYAPIFVNKAAEVSRLTIRFSFTHILLSAFDADKQTEIDVAHWLGRATLDIIGLASFDHNFSALKHETEEIYLAYKHMFEMFSRGPPLRYILEIQFPWLQKLWPCELTRVITSTMPIIYRFGRTAVQNKQRLLSSQGFNDDTKKHKLRLILILYYVVDANTDPTLPQAQRLTELEILDQINTILFAGYDTTGLAVSWCLHNLATHTSLQTRLREELLSVSLSSDPGERGHQIDGLPFLDKVVKESLRLNPPVHSSIRVATQDDIIPLSERLILRNGEAVDEVKIRKGSFIHIPLEGFNVCTDIWGPEAVNFDPDRWSNLPAKAKTHPGLAGILTFSFGGHSCPGWKFALTETKVLVASLILQFVFAPSEEIARFNMIVQRPYVKNKFELGSRLPLFIRPYMR